MAVVTTEGAAITAHIVANGYKERLRDAWSIAVRDFLLTPQKTSDHVKECERIISIENEGWMEKAVRKDT